MERPEIVYKYRTWNNKYHRKMLTENQLFLASPADFNDPFDCRIAPNLQLLLESKSDLNFYAKRIANSLKERFDNNEVNIQDFEESIKKSFEKKITESRFLYEDMYFNDHVKLYGILSLGERWNSILMWSHYGENHQGFCVGFDTQKLEDSMIFGAGGPVIYQTDFPEIHPNDQTPGAMFLETHSKSEEWTYEDEYRFVQMMDQDSIESRTVIVPDDFYREIVLGINCPEEHKDFLIMEAKKKSIPVFQANRVERKFQITRKLIN